MDALDDVAPLIGREHAFRDMDHRAPEKALTVAALASGAAMSRTAFAKAFRRVIGVPPGRYARRHARG